MAGAEEIPMQGSMAGHMGNLGEDVCPDAPGALTATAVRSPNRCHLMIEKGNRDVSPWEGRIECNKVGTQKLLHERFMLVCRKRNRVIDDDSMLKRLSGARWCINHSIWRPERRIGRLTGNSNGEPSAYFPDGAIFQQSDELLQLYDQRRRKVCDVMPHK